LRIATSVEAEGGYNATSYMHPSCFNLPRKYAAGANKMTPQHFVRQVLQDGSDSGRDILPTKTEELAAAIATTSIKKKKSNADGDGDDGGDNDASPKAWIASIKAAFEKLEADDGEPASKKAKAASVAVAVDAKREVITRAHIDAYASYKGCKADELKDLLRWNNQVLVGTKDVILTKVIDGMVHGRLGRCQLCNGGKLKFNTDNVHEIVCSGEFDEATQRKISCPYTTMPSKAPRFQPWCVFYIIVYIRILMVFCSTISHTISF
jgi:PADR1 (NUC008) domain